VAAELRRLGVRLQDDCDRVPADERRREPLELGVAGQLGLLVHRDRIHVRGAEPGRDLDAVLLGVIDGPVEQEAHPLAAVGLDDGVDGFEPFPGLDGVAVGELVTHTLASA